MKLCRFLTSQRETRMGLISAENQVLDLSDAGVNTLTFLLEAENPLEQIENLFRESLTRFSLDQIQLLSPVERQEVWAAGVTYLRSKKARMEESNFNANAYDRVYGAQRPEIFFKSLPEKVVGPGQPVGIRTDSQWNVPEPELALVINSHGAIVGYTIGNDMSSRDIEGENLLYLPQAKIYHRSCAVGPCILVDSTETVARTWTITLQIYRGCGIIFEGQTTVNQIKRGFEELVSYLYRSQIFPHGAILLTGTGIVPEDNFTLQPDDKVRIEVNGIGVLENTVTMV
ncbi:MAG: fumarylacetoacetate hydrolase family protein [Syntrophaceae bacterium]|nr:fumarylacetoacetate hydrolase family protein [Syntrophaceae bacterium]